MAVLQACLLCSLVLGALAMPRWILGKEAVRYMRTMKDMGRYDVMHNECGFEETDRIECGKRTYDEDQCRGRGCCYQMCEGCDKEIPWCFLAKRMLRAECAVAHEEKDDCGYYGITEGDCFFNRDCCWQPSGETNAPYCFKKKYSSLRLADGENTGTEMSGRVEIFHDDVWGTVCDDNFDDNAAKVVCGSLGFEHYIVQNYAHYGSGSGQIWMDGFSCSGEEDKLEDCSNLSWGSNDCSHSEDAGVTCSHGDDDNGGQYGGYNYNYNYNYTYNYGDGSTTTSPPESYEYVYVPPVIESYEYDYDSDEDEVEIQTVHPESDSSSSSSSSSSEEDEYVWYRMGGRDRARKGFKDGAHGPQMKKMQKTKSHQKKSTNINELLAKIRSTMVRRKKAVWS